MGKRNGEIRRNSIKEKIGRKSNEQEFQIEGTGLQSNTGYDGKEAGQFIKGLCGYAFDGVPMETKDAKIASAYAYAKVALDVSAQNRENGKKGGLIMAERIRGKKPVPKFAPAAGDDDAMEILLKGIVLSVAEEAERAAKDKAGK